MAAWAPPAAFGSSGSRGSRGAVQAHSFVHGGYTRPHPLDRVERARHVAPPAGAIGKHDVGRSVFISAGLVSRRALARPAWNGRLLFAGEATSGSFELWDAPMTAHGAMLTGERAALEVVQRLRADQESLHGNMELKSAPPALVPGAVSSVSDGSTSDVWNPWPWNHLPLEKVPGLCGPGSPDIEHSRAHV